MSTLSLPVYDLPAERPAFAAGWPWITALVLCACFAAACWDPHQTWYSSTGGDVDALVDRISSGNALRQLGFAAMGLFGLGLLLRPSERRIIVKPIWFYALTLFIAWTLISPAWSVDRGQTLKRLVVFAALCVTIAGVIRHYDMRQMAAIACIASVLTMTVGIANEARLAAGAFPGVGLYRFGGMMHPNHGALNCCVVILSCLYLFRIERRWWLLGLAAMGAGVLMLTKSRTALMTCMTGVAVYWLLAAPPRRMLMAMLLSAWLAGSLLWLHSIQMLPSAGGLITMGREDLRKEDPRELTGRTDIWRYALMQGSKDPNRALTGYGFETFWTPENARGVSDFVNFRISEGHNVYLDWYLELGIVGAGLYILLLGLALVRWTIAARMLESPSCAIAAGVIAAAVVHGLAESSSGDASLPTFFLYTSIALATLARPDELENA